jgi:hypothetical protein
MCQTDVALRSRCCYNDSANARTDTGKTMTRLALRMTMTGKNDLGEFHEPHSVCCEKYGLTSAEARRTSFSLEQFEMASQMHSACVPEWQDQRHRQSSAR